jgi:hypothetical protein
VCDLIEKKTLRPHALGKGCGLIEAYWKMYGLRTYPHAVLLLLVLPHTSVFDNLCDQDQDSVSGFAAG